MDEEGRHRERISDRKSDVGGSVAGVEGKKERSNRKRNNNCGKE